jgi:hypothetical protein
LYTRAMLQYRILIGLQRKQSVMGGTKKAVRGALN